MQIPFDSNFFDLFGIEKTYALDQVQLRDRFRAMQKEFHPDNFANATDHDRRISAQYASLINEAYSTLKDPVRRGQYMLSLLGVSTDDEHDTRMDQGFLMQQIELREELDVARSISLQALQKLSGRVEEEFSSRVSRLVEILDEENADEARHQVRELQFFNRLRDEIDEAEEPFY